jgi:hypothetical protein
MQLNCCDCAKVNRKPRSQISTKQPLLNSVRFSKKIKTIVQLTPPNQIEAIRSQI